MVITERVRWRESYRESLRQTVDDFRELGMLAPRFWVRVGAIAAVVIAVWLAAAMMLMEDAEFPGRELVIGIVIVAACVPFIIGVLSLVPQHVEVQRVPRVVFAELLMCGCGGQRR